MVTTFFLSRLRQALRDFRSAQGGNVAVIFVLATLPLISFVGAAVDYSHANSLKVKLQKALDASVLAAAVAKCTGACSIETAFFQSNVASTNPNATATFVINGDGSYSGTAVDTVPTAFLGVISIKSIPISASATAASKPGGTACILLLDATKTGAFHLTSASNVSAGTCEVHVRSTASQAFIANSPSNVNFKRVCVAGGAMITSGSIPNTETGCKAASNPFVGALPVPTAGSCTLANSDKALTGTVNPGTYCGVTRVSDGVTFNPGLYIIKGNPGGNAGRLQLGASNVTGNGVTFYFADANSQFSVNGGETITLSAPTSGAYKGILMFQPDGMPLQTVTISSTNKWNWTGLIYTPTFDWSGTSPSQPTMHVSIVANSLSWNSMSEWSVFDGGPYTINSSSSSAGAYLMR